MSYDRSFLAQCDRADLHRALRLLRMQDADPRVVNPAAAQYDGLATSASVRAELRRRGCKIPTKRAARKRISKQLETKIKLHTLALIIGSWFPPGSPMAAKARRVIFEGRSS